MFTYQYFIIVSPDIPIFTRQMEALNDFDYVHLSIYGYWISRLILLSKSNKKSISLKLLNALNEKKIISDKR